jgi:hypothetical protein
LACSKGPNRVGVSVLSPEDGNRSSFQNALFVVLEFQMMQKFQKPSYSEFKLNLESKLKYTQNFGSDIFSVSTIYGQETILMELHHGCCYITD